MKLTLLFKLLSATALIFTLGSCEQKNKTEVSKYLLLDSRVIEEVTNAKLEVGTIVKHAANPLFVEDKQWEMRFDNLYGNVIFDEEEQIYKCWYCPFIVDSSAMGMSIKERSRKYHSPKNREMAICYATSEDGISWEKPELGLVEYNNSKENNIIWRGPHGAGVFKDLQEEDPAKRYKMIFRGLSVSFSADGINWNEKTRVNGVDVAGDTHNNAFWAPTLNKYVGITRTRGPDFGREVARIESDDFVNWTKEEVVMHGTEKNLQTYAMPVFYYWGVYLGLVAIHQQSSDRVWTELTWSPDTKIWHRIDAGNPLIPCSEKELDYDYGCVYPCAYPVFKDDVIQLYYGASNWLHYGWRNGSLALATLRQDGFAGYVQLEESSIGIISTTSIPYNGKTISLTADVEEGGTVKVYVVNDEGETIGTAAVNKTVTDTELKFDTKIKSGNIQLKIEISQAKVYAFNFQ